MPAGRPVLGSKLEETAPELRAFFDRSGEHEIGAGIYEVRFALIGKPDNVKP
jgi:hypothetical protein